METRVQKWGNSYAIRIPINIVKSLSLKPNDILKLVEEDDRIIISLSKNNKISLEERFKEYKGENLSKEFVWDEPVGRELW